MSWLYILVRSFSLLLFLSKVTPRMIEEWLIEDPTVKETKIKLMLCAVTGFFCSLALTVYYTNIVIADPERSFLQLAMSGILSVNIFANNYGWYLLYRKTKIVPEKK